jgi:hypothetical protein
LIQYILQCLTQNCQGLDIPDIVIVIQYGITHNVPTTLQQGGQGGSSPTSQAIFLLMYKPWVKTIDLAAVEVDAALDPDHPNVPKLTIHSTKKAQTGITMLKIIQLEKKCLQKLFATYLRDTAPDGMYPRLPIHICSHSLNRSTPLHNQVVL